MNEKFDIEYDEKSNKIYLKGSIVFNNAVAVLAAVKKSCKEMDYIVIDLSSLTKADSSCLSVLISLIRFTKLENKKLVITKMPQFLSDLGRVSGLDDIMPVTG